MPQGKVKFDLNQLLNMVKNDRKFEVTSGVPRDASVFAAEYDVMNRTLTIYVKSDAIPEMDGFEIPEIKVELLGNADAVDEHGEPKELRPATLL